MARRRPSARPAAPESSEPVRAVATTEPRAAGATSAWAALALVVLTLIAYGPAYRAGFIWDDDDYGTENRTLEDLGGLARIWLEPGAVPQYYPLTFTSLWIEHQLYGDDPTGYHVDNVLLHALNAVLAWQVLAALGLPGAWLAAAVFAVHPVHSESVAWAAGRSDVLATAFLLAALVAHGAAPWSWRGSATSGGKGNRSSQPRRCASCSSTL